MRDFIVRLIHLPSGIKAQVDNWELFRSMHKMRAMALRMLRSKLYACRRVKCSRNSVVASYELPDELPYPHELSKYRRLAVKKD